jgi:hypothetical protein
MIYNCAKCGLSKSDGAMGSVLPQCKCDWNLLAPKKEWVGLTDEEIDKVAASSGYGYIDVARAIEAKLKDKNV